jgi:hypothetical protein
MATPIRQPKKYVPQLVKDGVFTGHVLIKQINSAQRAEFMDKFNFEEKDGQMKSRDKISSMQKVFIDICTDMVVGMELVRVEDKVKFSDPEDLHWEEDLYPLIQDIGQHVINPAPLSKNLKA